MMQSQKCFSRSWQEGACDRGRGLGHRRKGAKGRGAAVLGWGRGGSDRCACLCTSPMHRKIQETLCKADLQGGAPGESGKGGRTSLPTLGSRWRDFRTDLSSKQRRHRVSATALCAAPRFPAHTHTSRAESLAIRERALCPPSAQGLALPPFLGIPEKSLLYA